VAPVNNLEQRAAKKLAAAEGINYTEALRRVRNSGVQPSEVLAGQSAPSSSAAIVHSPRLGFVQKQSSHGRFAVRTNFSDAPSEDEYFVSSRNLFVCNSKLAGKTDLLRELVQESEADPKNIVIWDAGGGISHESEPDHAGKTIDLADGSVMTTDIVDFHRELAALLERNTDGESVIVVDSLDPLLSASGPIATEVVSMLVRALREGRQSRTSVYVSNHRILGASDHPLVGYLLGFSQFVLLGTARIERNYGPEELAKLPEMVSGWLMTSEGGTLYRAQVPALS
jgi:hypothetical protein